MKIKKLRKLNNKGFSLIEILVTIAVIGIITVPIMQSFITTAKLNAQATKLQNATSLAQGISEEFKAMTLTELEKYYGSPTVEMDDEGNPTGRLIYKNISNSGSRLEIDGEYFNYCKGANDETFFVDVYLDPNKYKEVLGINDYVFPNLADLYDGSLHGPIVLKSELTKYDNYVLSGLGISADKLPYVEKQATVKILLDYVVEGTDAYYFMDCFLTVTYKYDNKTYTPGTTLIESYTLNSTEVLPPVYVCYKIYDTNSTEILSGFTYGASDKVNIEYEYIGEDPTKQRNVKVYLAQQETRHDDYVDLVLPYMMGLKLSNLSITNNNNLFVYSNVPGWDGKKLTSGEKTVESLYTMQVVVKDGAPDAKAMTTFDSTKEN